MNSKSFNLFFAENLGLLVTASKHHLADVDEVEDALKDFETFVCGLEKDWSPSRIRDYIIQHNRDIYATCGKMVDKAEIDNKDDRVKGVSFINRKRHSDRIKMAYDLASKSAKKGINAKKQVYCVRFMVQPTDMSFIERLGFEQFLKTFYA